MAVAFDRKPSAGVGFELHHCGDIWRYFGMYIVTVEMQHIRFVAGPVQLDLVALAHANCLPVDYDFALVNMKFKVLNWARVTCRC